MNLQEHDRNPGAYAVRVRCISCHEWHRLADVRPDLDGPPFHAYFCGNCTPDEGQAARVYAREGWYRSKSWEWRKGESAL